MLVHAYAKVREKNGHTETYYISFVRDQVDGWIKSIEVAPREETTTTEYTLCEEAIKEICEAKLNR